METTLTHPIATIRNTHFKLPQTLTTEDVESLGFTKEKCSRDNVSGVYRIKSDRGSLELTIGGDVISLHVNNHEFPSLSGYLFSNFFRPSDLDGLKKLMLSCLYGWLIIPLPTWVSND